MHISRRGGFTLIELLTVLVIVGVLATVTAPSMGGLVTAVKVRNAASDLLMSLIYARSEAMKRGANVAVVPNGGDFSAGWTVQGAGATLQTEQALKGVDQAPGPTITYGLDGRLITTTPVDVQFKNSAYPSDAMHCVLAELSGKPYVKIDTNRNASDGCN